MTERFSDQPRHDHDVPEPQRQLIRPDLLAKLEAGIEAIHDSESFKEYLEAQRRFWRYSFNNVLLIMQQRSGATRVNSFGRWKQLGRWVKKGEHGIKILYPVFRKDPRDLDAEGNPTRKLVSFGVGNVFDLEQTAGRPLPERPLVELGGPQGLALFTELYQVAEQEGLAVEDWPAERLPEGEAGWYSRARKLIVVRQGAPAQVAVTAAHELAHHFGGDEVGYTMATRPHEETMAEACAWIVCAENGLDTSAASFEYVATWARDKQVLREAMGRIQRVSATMLNRLEAIRGVEQAAEEPVTVFQAADLRAE